MGAREKGHLHSAGRSSKPSAHGVRSLAAAAHRHDRRFRVRSPATLCQGSCHRDRWRSRCSSKDSRSTSRRRAPHRPQRCRWPRSSRRRGRFSASGSFVCPWQIVVACSFSRGRNHVLRKGSRSGAEPYGRVRSRVDGEDDEHAAATTYRSECSEYRRDLCRPSDHGRSNTTARRARARARAQKARRSLLVKECSVMSRPILVTRTSRLRRAPVRARDETPTWAAGLG